LLAHDQWYSPGTLASSTTKTGFHDIAEILLKVALNTNNPYLYQIKHLLWEQLLVKYNVFIPALWYLACLVHKIFFLLFNKQLMKLVPYPIVYLRNKSWKPECVLSFNMDWRILVF
jgi:hypothetical protein